MHSTAQICEPKTVDEPRAAASPAATTAPTAARPAGRHTTSRRLPRPGRPGQPDHAQPRRPDPAAGAREPTPGSVTRNPAAARADDSPGPVTEHGDVRRPDPRGRADPRNDPERATARCAGRTALTPVATCAALAHARGDTQGGRRQGVPRPLHGEGRRPHSQPCRGGARRAVMAGWGVGVADNRSGGTPDPFPGTWKLALVNDTALNAIAPHLDVLRSFSRPQQQALQPHPVMAPTRPRWRPPLHSRSGPCSHPVVRCRHLRRTGHCPTCRRARSRSRRRARRG